MILNPDAKLKGQVLSCLAQISKHSVELAELVVEAEIFPGTVVLLANQNDVNCSGLDMLERWI